MAVTARDRWDVTFTFRDNNGNSATTGVYYPGALTDAEVATAAGLLYAALATVTNANLEGYVISRQYVENAIGTAPPESEVERKLYLALGTADDRAAASMQIPSPTFQLEQDGTDVPLLGSVAFAALRTLLTNGGLGGGNGVADKRGEDITRVTKAVVRHRGRELRD